MYARLHFYISTFVYVHVTAFPRLYVSTFLHVYDAAFLHFYISTFIHTESMCCCSSTSANFQISKKFSHFYISTFLPDMLIHFYSRVYSSTFLQLYADAFLHFRIYTFRHLYVGWLCDCFSSYGINCNHHSSQHLHPHGIIPWLMGLQRAGHMKYIFNYLLSICIYVNIFT